MLTRYRREPGVPLSTEELDELKALEGRPIDLSDAREMSEDEWKNAVRGRLYRPVKEAVSLRIDVDVLVWLKKSGPGYQTRVNQVLREKMLEEMKSVSRA